MNPFIAYTFPVGYQASFQAIHKFELEFYGFLGFTYTFQWRTSLFQAQITKLGIVFDICKIPPGDSSIRKLVSQHQDQVHACISEHVAGAGLNIHFNQCVQHFLPADTHVAEDSEKVQQAKSSCITFEVKLRVGGTCNVIDYWDTKVRYGNIRLKDLEAKASSIQCFFGGT